jgi:hypothetical protein
MDLMDLMDLMDTGISGTPNAEAQDTLFPSFDG